MNGLLTAVLIALCVLITIRNFRQLKTSKVESQYLEAYKALINNDEKAMELIDKCLAESKNINEIKKAYVLKLIEQLKVGDDYSETLKQITPENFFYTNETLNNKLVMENSDVYIWLITAMAKAYSVNHKDVIKTIYERFTSKDDDLKVMVEYQVFVAIHNCIVGEGDHSFLRKLVEGEYQDYQYDKRVIGAYKRVTGIFMYHAHDELDDYLMGELKDYSEATLGSYLLKDMGHLEEFRQEKTEE